MTHGDRKSGDSFHLLVMDLHKQLNTLSSDIATENLDGAHVWQIKDADRPLIQAFMRGLNRTAPLKFSHPGLDTAVTRAFTGLPARVLRNTLQTHYDQSDAPVLPGLLQAALELDIWTAAARGNAPDYFPMYAGQSVGLISNVPSAGDVVRQMIDEARQVLRSLSP